MIVTKEFIKMGVASKTLNKAQCKILGVEFPLTVDVDELEVEKELNLKETNLFLFLRGKLALKAQEQIIKNYELVAQFHKEQKQKPKSVEESKIEEESKQESEEVSTPIDVTAKIYCDGACKGNPGETGCGVAIYYGDKRKFIYGDYYKIGTNNTAELRAIYKSLLIASKLKSAEIYSDSKYSIESITNWAYSWKKYGWKRNGREVKNLDIIKVAHELYDSIKDKVEVKYIKGHAGFEGNELADELANRAILERNREYREYPL